MPVKIVDVENNSPAKKAGIKSGDTLISINGHTINDVLDYQFYAASEKLEILLDRGVVSIYNESYDDLGLVFETYLMDRKKRCSNKCVFCFIDQMPPGMRETLYFKDDDARLSFLQGSYITLTNLSDSDVDRIIKMRLKINVSVHTTDPELRKRMTGNKNAGKALDYLYRIAKAGNEINCQIVLCPGYNDGAELERTLNDLTGLYPAVTSVACVPAGLTKYRENLTPLRLFDRKGAGEVIDIIEKYGEKMLEEHGRRVVFPSDEFFLIAGRNMPDYEYYEDFEQYENGVGMWASLKREFLDALDDIEDSDAGIIPLNRHCSAATGVLAAPLISELAGLLNRRISSLPGFDADNSPRANIYTIKNEFFGETITVAGLITGQDIIKQLLPEKENLGEELLIPETMLKADEDVFLDDITLNELSERIDIKIRTVPSDGRELLLAMLGIDNNS